MNLILDIWRDHPVLYTLLSVTVLAVLLAAFLVFAHEIAHHVRRGP